MMSQSTELEKALEDCVQAEVKLKEMTKERSSLCSGISNSKLKTKLFAVIQSKRASLSWKLNSSHWKVRNPA
jgi:hypothetical protein